MESEVPVAELVWASEGNTEFQDLRKRAEWVLEHRAKPILVEEGFHAPLVFVFRGPRFLNAVSLPTEDGRSVRADVWEAVELSEGEACIFVRVGRHPQCGEALLVALEHPEGRMLLCALFTRGEDITFGATQAWEGPEFGDGWEEALWQ